MPLERVKLCCPNDDVEWHGLNRGQRVARLLAGVLLLLTALSLPWSAVGWIMLAVVVGWIGATHVLAAATAYPGCPELGAVPSLLLRRRVKFRCLPWQWVDARLKLTPTGADK